MPSRSSSSSDKDYRRKAGNADTAYRASLLLELSEWEFVRHSDSEASSSGATKLCLSITV